MAKPMCARTNADDWSLGNSPPRQRQINGAYGDNQYVTTQMSAIGRRENWRRDRSPPIVDSRPLGRALRTARTLPALHWTLQAPHCRQRADPLGTKARQIYRPTFGIQSQVILFQHRLHGKFTSQTHRPPIELWKISWCRWASGGLVVVGMESIGFTTFETESICV